MYPISKNKQNYDFKSHFVTSKLWLRVIIFLIIRNKKTVGQGSHVGRPTMLAYLQNDHSDSFILKIQYIKFISLFIELFIFITV